MMVPLFRGQDCYGRRVHLRTSGKSHVDAEKVVVSGKGLRSVRLRFYLETGSARTTPGNLSAAAPLS
jgi:hypothetical protein